MSEKYSVAVRVCVTSAHLLTSLNLIFSRVLLRIKLEMIELSEEVLQFRREIRDPIYGYIRITKLENDIIDTPVFQRLDRILQMPTAHFVYPSAKYSRKCHSLGVMHLVHRAFSRILYLQHSELREKIPPLSYVEPVLLREVTPLLDKLEEYFPIEKIPFYIQAIRLAGLLHDIGHGPFSHTLEDVCKVVKVEFNHEEMGKNIIEKLLTKSENNRQGILDEKMGKLVSGILTGTVKPLFLHQIVHGAWGCDVLDYLTRDAYHAGTLEYGLIDVERVLSGFVVVDENLLLSKSQIEAAIDCLESASFMYSTVYYHKTSRIFDLMIAAALQQIPDFLKEITSSPNELAKYDDCALICKIKERSDKNGNYKKASETFDRVLTRIKDWRAIARERLDIGIIWLTLGEQEEIREPSQELDKKLRELKEEIGKMAEGFEIEIDIRPKIRPVGLRIEQIITWLSRDNIYDFDDRKKVPLYDVSPAYYRSMSRLTVPVTVFAERSKYDKLVEMDKQKAKSLNIAIGKKLRDEIEKIRSEYLTKIEKLF